MTSSAVASAVDSTPFVPRVRNASYASAVAEDAQS